MVAHAYSPTAGKVESLDSLGYNEFQASLSYCETLSQNTKPKSRKTPEARDDQFLLGNLSWRDQLHQPFMTGSCFFHQFQQLSLDRALDLRLWCLPSQFLCSDQKSSSVCKKGSQSTSAQRRDAYVSNQTSCEVPRPCEPAARGRL